MYSGFLIVLETSFPYDNKRSARMRTRHSGRWLLKQPRLGARMCQGTFFFTGRKRKSAHCFKTRKLSDIDKNQQWNFREPDLLKCTRRNKNVRNNKNENSHSYPHRKRRKMREIKLYTILSTLSTDEKTESCGIRNVQNKQLFCEVITAIQFLSAV